MPITPKEDCKETEVLVESEDTDVWSEDQKSHQYYYDDAHGYEKYVEGDDEEDKKDDE
ncbi:MAG: hypothetical protein ABIU09_10470 [Pyrinomonadaceae bacterium]